MSDLINKIENAQKIAAENAVMERAIMTGLALSKSPIEDLVNSLKDDPGYYMVWKANLSQAFQNSFRRHCLHNGVYEIANMAAEDFLRQLMNRGSTDNQAV